MEKNQGEIGVVIMSWQKGVFYYSLTLSGNLAHKIDKMYLLLEKA